MNRPPPRTQGSAEGRPDPAASLHRFLRYSHIFSSAIEEILGSRYLDEVCEHSLTLAQFNLLKLIALNGHHQVGEVAHFLGVSSPAVSKNIDKLERLGLVIRSTSEGDRRATLLAASDEGYGLVRRYEMLKAERLAPVLERFGDERVDQLSTLLEQFAVSLLQHERPGRGYCLRCAVYIDEDCPVGSIRGGCPYRHLRHRRGGPAEA